MKKVLIPLIFLLSFGLVSACVFPDQIKFYYPIDLDDLKESFDQEKIDYTIVDNTVLIQEDEYSMSINDNVVSIVCKDPMFECIDEADFEDIINNLEDWDAYDLSKDDKENIAALFDKNIVIRKIDKTAIWGTKIKNIFLKYVGKVICVTHEQVQECKDVWCSLTEIRGEACPAYKC